MSSKKRRRRTEVFWADIKKFSPILCRLMAKANRNRAMTTAELATRSGLSEYEVVKLSAQTDWKGVDIWTVKAFSEACGVDFTSAAAMRKLNVYLRGKTLSGGGRIPPQFLYLRRSPEWTTYFQPLINHLRKGNQK